MSTMVEDLKNAVITFVNIAEEEVVSKEFEELDNNGVEILKAIDELEQYRAIGTVSDFREFKEKAKAKKAVLKKCVYHCPSCGMAYAVVLQGYCTFCGQHMN